MSKNDEYSKWQASLKKWQKVLSNLKKSDAQIILDALLKTCPDKERATKDGIVFE